MTITDPPSGRPRPEFVTLIAIYQFATAAILLLLACLATAMGIPLLFFMIADAGTIAFSFLWIVFLALAFGYSVASLVVGWGLLMMREWARLGAIVLAAFALVGFPIWTIVAIIILFYLTSDDAKRAFQHGDARVGHSESGSADLAPAAAYKTDPTPQAPSNPTEETRKVHYTPGEQGENGSPSTTPATEETRRIDTPISMPPGDPLDEPADSLQQAEEPAEPLPGPEPATLIDAPGEPAETVEAEQRGAWHWQDLPRSSDPHEGIAEAGSELETQANEAGERQEHDSETIELTEHDPERERRDDDGEEPDPEEPDERRNPGA
jgi:hypothetical protein